MKLAIVATPRSGSTWLYGMLLDYLRQKDPEVLGLEEYFNVEQLRAIFKPVDGKTFAASKMSIAPIQAWDPPEVDGHQLRYQWTEKGIEKTFAPFSKDMIAEVQGWLQGSSWPEQKRLESMKRMEWLARDPRKNIIVKVMSDDLEINPELAKFLGKNFEVIFLKRESLIEQVQSYALCMASGVWHSKKLALEKIESKPFVCKKEWVDQIMSHLSAYSRFQKIIPGTEVTYEQLCQKEPSNKFDLIQNSEQVLSWMRGSKIAVITDTGRVPDEFYERVLKQLRKTNEEVLSLREYFNIQKLRYEPEMQNQVQFMAKIGAWGEFRYKESMRRLENLRNNPSENVLLEVAAKDFDDNPELGSFLSENFKIVYLPQDKSGAGYATIRAKLRTAHIHFADR